MQLRKTTQTGTTYVGKYFDGVGNVAARNSIYPSPVIPVLVTGIHTSELRAETQYHYGAQGRGMDPCDKHRDDGDWE